MDKDFIKSIFADMAYVSNYANPYNYKTSGKTTLKKFFDKFLPGDDLKDIYEEYFKCYGEMSFEEFEKYYNENLEINFWVYDRYKDGSFIMYTLYGSKNDNFKTYEILTDEIFDL